MFSSDSQAMGRVGKLAASGANCACDESRSREITGRQSRNNDNFRVLRYVAKITINPAITQGVSHILGSVEVGKMADLVLWEPQFFGAKPETYY